MSQQPSGQGISEKIQNLSSKYGQMLNELDKAVVGRYDSKTAVLLGLMTGFPTLLVGDRGVAKTMLIELLPKVIEGLNDKDVFVVQVSEYTDPSEIFGVPDIQKLVSGEGFDLKTDGFLPSAKVAFVDEIFYTSEKVRSTLLRAVNEKKINVFGKEIKLPWVAFYAAANKVDLENPSDLALLDRFNIRGFILDIPFILDNVDKLADETMQVMSASENPAELKKVIALNDVEETRKVLDQMVRDFFNSKEALDLLKKVYYVVGDILASLKDTDAYESFYRSADEDYTHISTRARKRLNYVAASIALVRGVEKPTYLDYLLALLFTLPVDVQSFKIVMDKIRDEWNKAVNRQEKKDATQEVMKYLNENLLADDFIKASGIYDNSKNAIANLDKKIPLTKPFEQREQRLVRALPEIVKFLTRPEPISYSIWLVTKEDGKTKVERKKIGDLSGNPFQKLEELLKLLESYRTLLDEASSPKEKTALIIGLSKLVVNFGSTSSFQNGFKVPFFTLLDAISLFINNLSSKGDVRKVVEQVVNDAKNNAIKLVSNEESGFSGWEALAPLLEQYGMKVPGILEVKRQIEDRAEGLSKNLDSTVTGITDAGEKIMEMDEDITKTLISLAG
ncbi:MoxR-type AAA ATPase virus structural protein [Acidianus two-tailed virus 2]|nr:MoxR-type AAA ATPase virus structural protein [Acidianus two-tailed virus 2]